MSRSPILTLSALLFFMLCIYGAASATPYFLLETAPQWNEAMSYGNVQPVTPLAWDDYMYQWGAHLEEGEPYPENVYVTPQLYVYGGGGGGGLDPEDAGLVMYWDAPPNPDVKYAAAWRYEYPLDPNLSNSIITVTVTAPQFDMNGNQVNNVSFGIQDIAGCIRSWHWRCGPGWPIPWNLPTQITIDTNKVGLAAATPAANGYMNNPGFNITQSMSFIVDENATWVGGAAPVPPPGQPLPAMWNYWHNILVTPKLPVKGNDPVKWSQPPVIFQQGDVPIYLGWDEKSLYDWRPIVADDWECATDDPITDIHWWGSFIGWDSPDPPQMPIGFHLAIWTDVPDPNPQDPLDFSHPGTMIWEHYCYNYQWNFAGYDEDPRVTDPETFRESCFQFMQYLPEDHWFYQDPQQHSIYWLSIAAIYPPDQPPQYPWGWKTRPHHFQDDAVRIQSTNDSTGMPAWPPHVGYTWNTGVPIKVPEYPDPAGVTWDVAFELTTRITEQPYNDLGDAPDSTNNFAAPMTAYPAGGPPGTLANYPTAYQGGLIPAGPLHLNPQAVTYLGPAVTLENEADQGPDQDPTNNIIPPNDVPDLDMADDGVLGLPLSLPHCQPSTFQYQVTAVLPNQQLYVNVWFDWNRDGDWDDTMDCSGVPAPEWAVQNQSLIFAAPGIYVVTTPQFLPWHPNTDPDPIWMRITLSDQTWTPNPGIVGDGGSGPTAGYMFGETEDYYFTPQSGGQEDKDWGDAPDPAYPTLSVNNGANHVIGSGLMLGVFIDAENDGQPDPKALGDDNNPLAGPDDEDGVVWNTPLIPGQNATVTVTATVPVGMNGFLDAWIDFNGDGQWDDSAGSVEKIANSLLATNGPNPITFAVPGGIANGWKTFARFRISSVGGLAPTGAAADGEVEDEEIGIGFKWIQRPDLTPMGIDVNATNPFILADDFLCKVTGPITDIHVWGSWLNDELPFGDPNQVKFTLSIHKDIPASGQEHSRPGDLLWYREFQPGSFMVHQYATNIDEGWMDPPAGYFFPGDHVCWLYEFFITDNPFIQRGTERDPVVYWLDVQAEPLDGMARFGWKTSLEHWNDDAVWVQGMEPYSGVWNELRYPPQHEMQGQSIDLAFAITGHAEEVTEIDWGDAPDANYQTVSANNGASHVIVPNLFLGNAIDGEPDGQPTVLADGDDNNNLPDEDGVLGTTPLAPGVWVKAQVVASAPGFLDAWIDYNIDGDWGEADELVFAAQPLNGGVNNLNFLVPNTATPGNTYARLRFSSTGGLPSFGPATDGEVEDYIITIQPPPTIVNKGGAKKLALGSPVLIVKDVVTANFGSMGWYFSEPDRSTSGNAGRSAGIGVLPLMGIPAPWVVGDVVTCYGQTALIDCELMIQEFNSWLDPDTLSVDVMAQSGLTSGGGVFGNQPGLINDVTDAVPPPGGDKPAFGLNTVASLVQLFGRCNWVDATGTNFWIDDGSGNYIWDGTQSPTGEPVRGIKVRIPFGYAGPTISEGNYYSVIGIMRTDNTTSPFGDCVRWLWPRSDADILLLAIP